MNIEALALQQSDQVKQSKKLFAEIFVKYQETLIAVGGNQRFLEKKVFEKAPDEILANKRLDLLKTALDAFRLDIGRYPTAAEGLDALLWNKSSADNWKGPYLPMPCKLFLDDFRYGEDPSQAYRLDKRE